MTKNKHTSMKIIVKQQEKKLEWKNKINIYNKKYTLKDKTTKTNKIYKAKMPKSLYDYLELTANNNTIYFYNYDTQTCITTKKPKNKKNKQIKVHKTNHTFSLPKQFFNPNEFTNVILTLHLNKTDNINKKQLLTIKLN